MCGKLPSSTAPTGAALLLLIARRLRSAGRCCRGGRRNQPRQGQHEQALEALERLRAWALASQLRHALAELQIDVAHAPDETDDRDYELDELHRREHLLEPLAQLVEVRNVRRRGRLLHSKL
jgi:hypothetical protein